ncbi:MAG: PQQ-binding-like beta-propeller repeat protein, partial [Armatimonadota bacterium]
MPFDYAYQVAAAGGAVYFGSSADNKVYALDLATGQERWSFMTGAPIRFAPHVADGRVLVASDDGCLYCLSADEGELIWKFRAAPRDEKLIGNGRMISRWPLRSGVIVHDRVVYLTAGMWPAEGVYVYALRIDDGSVVWTNDTSGAMYLKLPHGGAEAITGVAPQGYLLASGDTLLVPTGRSVPAGFDRETGRFLYYRAAENKHNGGAWASVAGDLVFCWKHAGGPDIDIRIGEAMPAKSDGLMASHCRTGASKLTLGGKHRVVVKGDTVYASGSGFVSAHDRNALNQVRWQAPCERVYELSLAGDTVLAAGRGTVMGISAATGDVLWTIPIDAQARGLAVADGRLLVSAATGDITCFGPEPVANPPVIAPEVDDSPYPTGALADAYAELAQRIVDETGVTEGYCLDYGASDGRLAYELAKLTDLSIYCIEPDESKVAAARKALDAAGLYGVRVTVDQGPLDSLPYASYFANLIVSGGLFTGNIRGQPSPKEAYRVLRPCGGVAHFAVRQMPTLARQLLPRLLRSAGVPEDEVRMEKGTVRVVRGPLPGAGDWTHQYADAGKSGCASDQIVKWPLGLLWFGGPGPDRMMSRHWKGTAPLSTNGRLFVAGQHHVIAVDAYNGRELWATDIPSGGIRAANSRGSNVAADSDSVYLATGGVCFRLSAETGEQQAMYRLPLRRERYSLAEAQTFSLGPEGASVGTVVVGTTAAGLELTLSTNDTTVTNRHRVDQPRLGDSWELFFDFRPEAQRGGLYGPGAFQVIVVPATIEQATTSWKAGAGPAHPGIAVRGTRSDTGSETMVSLSWDEVRRLVGRRPSTFDFGVTLNSSDDGDKVAGRTHKFANADSKRLTSACATFAVDVEGEGAAEQDGALLAPELAESRIWG